MKKQKDGKQGKKRLLVGITGGIGAGKSALATVYRKLGYPVFSADEIAREIVAPGSPALNEICAQFGPSSLKPDGSLNRTLLREMISADPNLRLKLEAITHPRIQERSLALSDQAFLNGAELVFYEAPLLYEAKSDTAMDKVICVHAPDALRIERTMKRDKVTREAAEKLLLSQMPQREKVARADYLIENKGPPAELESAALELLNKLI